MNEPTALAQLRHLYQSMVNGAVRDTASAKRIADGLLAPAIAALERTTPQPTQAQAGAVPLTDDQLEKLRIGQEYWQWGVSENVFRHIARSIEAAHGIKGGQHGPA